MAITTLDQLTAALDARQGFNLFKPSMGAKAAGTFQSLWMAAGIPSAGLAPVSVGGAAPNSATVGVLPFINPATGKTYIGKVQMSGATVGSLILYDRLVHTALLNGTLITAQTVNSAALTRATTGVGVEPWLEWYTATGATASNVSLSYTNQAGTAGRATPLTAMPSAPAIGQMMPLPLAAGDTGVRSVQTLTLSANTLTAGSFGITLMKRLAAIPISIPNVGVVLDFAALGMPDIENNACLSMMVMCSTTNTGVFLGSTDLIQG